MVLKRKSTDQNQYLSSKKSNQLKKVPTNLEVKLISDEIINIHLIARKCSVSGIEKKGNHFLGVKNCKTRATHSMF